MNFKQYSFQKKIFLSCFFLNLILLLLCSIFFYYYTSKSLKRHMHDTVSSDTTMLMNNLDSMLTDADNALKLIQTSPSFLKAAKEVTDSNDNYFSAHVPVNSICKSNFLITLHSADLDGSISYLSEYYDNIGVSITRGTYNYIDKDILRKNNQLTQFLDENTYVSYAAPHTDFWEQKGDSFSVIRSMRDMYHHYGILVFDYSTSVITSLLDNFEKPEDHFIMILDTEKKPVFVSNESIDIDQFYSSYQTASNNNPSQNGTFSHNNSSLSCYMVSPLTGWTFILSNSTASYMKSLKELVLISAILFLSLSVVMSSFLLLLTHLLTKPLKQLIKRLKDVNPGDNIEDEEISQNTGNEIVILTNTIHKYLSEIYDKNQRLTDSRQRELQAHYSAMEAQLNPHFLYNTLSVIGATGLTYNSTTVYSMCNELASLLRYSLSFSGQTVHFNQEIQHANSYLYIMRMRFENDLECNWNIDPAINKLYIPKLILQPLIENCFQHGFQQNNYEVLPPWRIKIHAYLDKKRWYVSISDNGAPFDKDKLITLKQRIQQLQSSRNSNFEFVPIVPRQGFGLENTILRLSIYYDGDVYFNVIHENEEWTTITIGGPLK